MRPDRVPFGPKRKASLYLRNNTNEQIRRARKLRELHVGDRGYTLAIGKAVSALMVSSANRDVTFFKGMISISRL